MVLDGDITKGAPTDIAKAKVLATFIDGGAVYEGEGFPKPGNP